MQVDSRHVHASGWQLGISQMESGEPNSGAASDKAWDTSREADAAVNHWAMAAALCGLQHYRFGTIFSCARWPTTRSMIKEGGCERIRWR